MWCRIRSGLHPAITQNTLQKVVKTIIEEENLAMKVMPFGLEQLGTEELHGREQELCDEIVERPQFVVLRIAPVLKTLERFKSVFSCRNRSEEHRSDLWMLVSS